MSAETKKKYSASNVVALVIFAIMAIFAIFLIEEVIRCFIVKKESIFALNYIKNIIFLTISAFIYWIMFNFEQKNRFFCKEWLKIVLIIYIFMVFNVANFFNLYTYRVVRYIIFAINGVYFAIFGVSIYYNYLKNENNKVKAKAKMVVLFSLALTIAFAFGLELVWYLIDIISAKSELTFLYALYDILFSLAGSVIMNILFYLSLNKTKKFINSCLIDIQ